MKKIFQNFDFTEVDATLDEFLTGMKRDLIDLVSYPSMYDASTIGPGKPYGQAVRDVLDHAMIITRGMGFETVDVDGHCGYADLIGRGEGQVGVAAHLDVVPAVAEDWSHNPFDMIEVDGVLYGRGASDNKGPLVACLYAGLALKKCGIPMTKTVRFIMGCNEEVSMSDAEYYRQHVGQPDVGFTPDGSWPVVIGEKGFCHFMLSDSWEDDSASKQLVLERVDSGLRNNIVPDYAEALLHYSGDIPRILREGTTDVKVAIGEDGQILVTAFGTAAHASTPWYGENALRKLIDFLFTVPFGPTGAKRYIDKLSRICADDYGTGLGVDGEDEHSKTTCAPTMLSMNRLSGELSCDIRYLVTGTGANYIKLLQEKAEKDGLTFRYRINMDPVWLGKDHPDALILADAFNSVTGKDLQPLVLGGGSYCKKFDNMMSFGPEYPDRTWQAHQTDEHITVDNLLHMAKIYARGIYGLAK